jgi:hypothetical protein
MVPLKTPVVVYGCKRDDLQPLPQITVAADRSGAAQDIAPASVTLPPG